MTLVIIDMQPYFEASGDVVEEVVKEVRRARERRTGIVVVEYGSCGPTHRLIQRAVRGYDRQAWVKKHDDDGGAEVMEAAHQHGFWDKSWRFCGVNTCYCVCDTVKSIVRAYPRARFEYAIKAMNCNCGMSSCARYFKFHAGLKRNHRIV